MATYLELRSLFSDGDLRNRVAMAMIISINTILEGTPTANDKAYAAVVTNRPGEEAKKLLMFLLAANKSATIANIQSSSDASIQTNVDAIVPVLIDALAGV